MSKIVLVALLLMAAAPAHACTVPPVGWQPPRHGSVWCGQFWDRSYCRYGCPSRRMAYHAPPHLNLGISAYGRERCDAFCRRARGAYQ